MSFPLPERNKEINLSSVTTQLSKFHKVKNIYKRVDQRNNLSQAVLNFSLKKDMGVARARSSSVVPRKETEELSAREVEGKNDKI